MGKTASWDGFVQWLEAHAPALAGTLQPGVTDKDLDHFEREVGYKLPASVRAWWTLCGGQASRDASGVAAGFVLLSPADALAEWTSWKELREESSEEMLEDLDQTASSTPGDAIATAYSKPGWIPLAKEEFEGNYFGVDLEPREGGVEGQVINFGRDEDDKQVLFWDWAGAIDWLAEQTDALSVEEADDGPTIEHSGGRLLGVLADEVKAGTLPGKRPARKRQKAPPRKAAAKSPAKARKPKPAEPLPTPPLPEPAQRLLDDFIAQLVARLGEEQRPQSEAYCHMSLEDPRRPLESSVRGDSLRMVPYKPPVGTNGLPKFTVIRDIAAKAMEGGVAIQMIELRFRREGNTWKYQTTMELAENHKRLWKARKPLDETIADGLREVLAAEPRWDFASLSYDGDPDATRHGLHVVVRQRPGLPVTLVPGEALAAAYAEVEALYSAFGRCVHTGSWHVDRKRLAKCSVHIFCG